MSSDALRPARQACPTLAALSLSAEDWGALARQGFVAGERRGGTLYFKLRYRDPLTRRQRIRGLGASTRRAAAVRAELAWLQRPVHREREAVRGARQASHALRRARESVRPLLAQAGFRFHGAAIRRRRGRGAGEVAAVDSQRPIPLPPAEPCEAVHALPRTTLPTSLPQSKRYPPMQNTPPEPQRTPGDPSLAEGREGRDGGDPRAATPRGALAVEAADGKDLGRLQRQRIAEYHASSLELAHPLRAALGAMNAHLMDIAVALADRNSAAIIAAPSGWERNGKLLGAIDVQLRVMRQVDRFVQLDLKLAPPPSSRGEATG